MQFNILIVGQGLAGTLLGSALEDADTPFSIVDDNRSESASKIAAGLIHPISGRRYVKAWNYDALLSVLKFFYGSIERKLDFKILHPHHVLLGLTSNKEENDLLSQAHRYEYEALLKRFVLSQDILSAHIKEIYAVQSYRLDIPILLEGFRQKWLREGKLQSTRLNYALISKSQGQWFYGGIAYSHVVFCEGAAVLQNPFFKHLPVIPNKGQMIWIESDTWTLEHTLKHHLIVSGYGHRHWVGATYEWAFEDAYPTLLGKNELMSRLQAIVKVPYQVLAHQSGLRPTVQDRKPILASSPEHQGMWAINGFGTKGASMGPYVIKQFIDLLHDATSRNEFGTDRFFR